MTNDATWYLGAMNDGLFIVNRPPSPAGTDVPPGMYPNGPTVFLNVIDLPQEKAQAIVDEHNAAIRALSADRGEADYSVVPPEMHGGDETGQAAETTDAAWANGWNACRSAVMRKASGVYAATTPSPAETGAE